MQSVGPNPLPSTPPRKPPRLNLTNPFNSFVFSPEDPVENAEYYETLRSAHSLPPSQARPLTPRLPLPLPPSPARPLTPPLQLRLPPSPAPLPRQKKLQISMAGKNNITTLTERNYDSFIMDKEKVLIIFYDSEDISSSAVTAEFGLAAASSYKRKHAFGAVDCTTNLSLCCRKGIYNLPLLKLFSNGFEVSTLRTLDKFNSDQMKMLISMAPVLTQSRAEKYQK